MVIAVFMSLKEVVYNLPHEHVIELLKFGLEQIGRSELFHTIDTSSLDDMLTLIFDLIPIMIIMSFLQGIMKSLRGFSI